LCFIQPVPASRGTTAGIAIFLGALTAMIFAEDLPEGAAGIASRYAGDSDIENDLDVIFTENFEKASFSTLTERWEQCQHTETMSFSMDIP
jgi:hypothetical protein